MVLAGLGPGSSGTGDVASIKAGFKMMGRCMGGTATCSGEANGCRMRGGWLGGGGDGLDGAGAGDEPSAPTRQDKTKTHMSPEFYPSFGLWDMSLPWTAVESAGDSGLAAAGASAGVTGIRTVEGGGGGATAGVTWWGEGASAVDPDWMGSVGTLGAGSTTKRKDQPDVFLTSDPIMASWRSVGMGNIDLYFRLPRNVL